MALLVSAHWGAPASARVHISRVRKPGWRGVFFLPLTADCVYLAVSPLMAAWPTDTDEPLPVRVPESLGCVRWWEEPEKAQCGSAAPLTSVPCSGFCWGQFLLPGPIARSCPIPQQCCGRSCLWTGSDICLPS